MRVKRLRLRGRIALPCLAATVAAIVLTQVLGTAARLGLGLRLLEERAAELRATLEADSAPDRGTLVLVTMPR